MRRIKAVTATGPWWKPTPRVGSLAGKVGDDWFRIRLPWGWAMGNPFRPVLVGQVAAGSSGTHVRLQVERPWLWREKLNRVISMIVLSIFFVVGVIGVLTGSTMDDGTSMLPIALLPLGMAAVFIVFDYVFRRAARWEERRLRRIVTEVLGLTE